MIILVDTTYHTLQLFLFQDFPNTFKSTVQLIWPQNMDIIFRNQAYQTYITHFSPFIMMKLGVALPCGQSMFFYVDIPTAQDSTILLNAFYKRFSFKKTPLSSFLELVSLGKSLENVDEISQLLQRAFSLFYAGVNSS